jgi:lysophospholipase L1-like esterase
MLNGWLVTMFTIVGFMIASPSPAVAATEPTTAPTAAKFSFGPGAPPVGYTKVSADDVYSTERGWGFDLNSKVPAAGGGGGGGADPQHAGFVTSDKSFFFSVKLPEGNYNVTVTLGDSQGESTTTVKAESRRLMLQQVHTAAGKFATRTFTVNIRDLNIAGGGQVRIKAREKNYLHWDDKLTLEFSGSRPCLCALEITKVEDAITVYLAGDSTVTDQPTEPWNSWGQMLPRWFKPGVAIANHAESGESLGSFLGEKRLDKIMGIIKPGDYLFIQMGHNDEKEKGANAGAYKSYTQRLKQFVTAARDHGALPVLITPVQRRRFDKSGKVEDTHGDYPDAVRKVAAEMNVPLIDLTAMSTELYQAWGPDASKAGFQDGTHHNNYGSYEIAKLVVNGIRANHLGIEKYLTDDAETFDPKHPDPVEKFDVPPSPMRDPAAKPDGN